MMKALALLAEDEPLVRMMVADALEDAGFQVIEAGTAAEALQHIKAEASISVLVTDVQMPGSMDGFELARQASQLWPAMSIIVCSGRMRPGAGQLPPGARFVSKPFDAAVIVSTLRDMDAL